MKYSGCSEDQRRIDIFKRDAFIHSEVSHAPFNILMKRVPLVYEVGCMGGAYILENSCRAESKDLYYMVLEHVAGDDISQKLKSPDTPFDEKLTLLKQAVEALCVIHEPGYVHRDVKPENFLLCDKKGVMVTDFGLSIKSGEYAGLAAGSPRYMAPEAMMPNVLFPSADIYSWGVMLYESFESGDHPYLVHPTQMPWDALNNLYKIPKSREMKDSGLWVIARNCLSIDHKKRYKNGPKLLHALDKV